MIGKNSDGCHIFFTDVSNKHHLHAIAWFASTIRESSQTATHLLIGTAAGWVTPSFHRRWNGSRFFPNRMDVPVICKRLISLWKLFIQWHTKSTNSLPCFCLMDVSSIRDPIEVHRRSDEAILSAVLSTFPNSGGVEQSSCKARGDCCWPWKGKKIAQKKRIRKSEKNRMKQTK